MYWPYINFTLILILGLTILLLAFLKWRMLKKLQNNFSQHLKDDAINQPLIINIRELTENINNKMDKLDKKLDNKN